MLLQMRVQHRQLGLAQLAVAPTVGQVQQGGQTALLVTLEVVAHGIGVDQQGVGDILGRAAARQQDHRFDPIGLAFVARAPVRRAQIGEF